MQKLTTEDQLFVLMQAAQYLTATRGSAAPEIRICYERAEPLCHSLDRPLLLYVALTGQWRYALITDKLTAAMQIAERVYSLAQVQDDPALMIGAYRALAATHYYLGDDFEFARQYAMRGVQIWRSENAKSHAEEYYTPALGCLGYGAMSEWNLGESASCQANMNEAISVAKELNDTNGLALTLNWALTLAYLGRDPAEADRLASEIIQLSMRHNLVFFLAVGTISRGWARSTSGDTVEGILWIKNGIADYRAAGWTLAVSHCLAMKAEALYLVDRTSEALDAIIEAEALAERFEQRYFCAELHRLRAVFLMAIGAEDAQIEASFARAIRIAKEQKSVSLQKRAEATYTEYRRQKMNASGERGFRLPLCSLVTPKGKFQKITNM